MTIKLRNKESGQVVELPDEAGPALDANPDADPLELAKQYAPKHESGSLLDFVRGKPSPGPDPELLAPPGGKLSPMASAGVEMAGNKMREEVGNIAGAALDGATLGLGPGVQGGIAALKAAPGALVDFAKGGSLTAYQKQLLDAYKAAHDKTGTALDEASDAQPVAGLAGSLLPAAVGMPESFAGRVGLNFGMGALGALGHSKADLTKGELVPALKDAGAGGATSAVAGLVAEPFIAGARLMANKGAAGQAAAKAAQDKLIANASEKAIASARGSLGGNVAAGLKALENAKEIVASPSSTAAEKSTAQAFLSSPEGEALVARWRQNVLAALPSRLSDIASAETGLADAVAKGTPQAQAAASAKALGDWASPLKSRLPFVAKNILPGAIGSILGLKLGGPEGAVGGGLAGGVVSAAMGSPGRTLANAMRNPAVRNAAFGLLEKSSALPAAGGAALTAGARALGADYAPLFEALGLPVPNTPAQPPPAGPASPGPHFDEAPPTPHNVSDVGDPYTPEDLALFSQPEPPHKKAKRKGAVASR